jgi:hypothetical protein
MTTWTVKINTTLQQNIWYLSTCISWDEDENILSCANKHKTLTMVSLRDGNISSTHCSKTLGTLVARECRIISSLPSPSSDMMLCGL